MVSYPDWVLKHKTKGTEIRKIGQRYYLYKIASRWSKEKKRPVKVTLGFLGTITETGLVKSRTIRLAESLEHITIKEYGAFQLVWQQNQDIVDTLKELFPTWWKELWSMAYLRLMYQTPLKHLDLYYQTSFISETLPQVRFSDKSITACLRDIGQQRGKIVTFLQRFVKGSSFVLIDATHVISLSSGMQENRLGYNNKHQYDPQVNLLFIYDTDRKLPVYYRLVSGNIREIKALKMTLLESGLNNAIVVTDKGFYSQENVEAMENEELRYIIPMKRNSSLIDYTATLTSGKEGFDGYFQYEERLIWYKKTNNMWLYLDEELKLSEQKDYLHRVQNNRQCYTLETFHTKQHRFGTIALLSNLKDTDAPDASKVFNYFKSRSAIEIMFDAFKNILSADRTYMQGDIEMETWMFIHHLALVFYYRLYQRLMDKDLLKKYSPKDLLLYFSQIKKIKIQDQWKVAEIPQKIQTLIKKYDIPIP
jgi:transposase